MRWVERAGWRAQRPTGDASPLARVQGLVVHHSGSQGDEHQEHPKCLEEVRAIQRFHMHERGWLDIAYHWVICPHGVAFEGRSMRVRSAAQGTDAGNAGWLAACVLGVGSPEYVKRNPRALDAILGVRALVVHQRPSASGVRPHSDFHATECPGEGLRRWIGRQGFPAAPLIR